MISLDALQLRLSELSSELKEWRLKARKSKDALKVAQADVALQTSLRQSMWEQMDTQLRKMEDLQARLHARNNEMTRSLDEQTKLTVE